MNNTFGENVRKFRILRGLTQADLADLLGYKNKASIGKIENGDNDLPLSMAEKIAQALRVDIMALTQTSTFSDGTMEFLPYLAKADETTLQNIRAILRMPEKGEQSSNSTREVV